MFAVTWTRLWGLARLVKDAMVLVMIIGEECRLAHVDTLPFGSHLDDTLDDRFLRNFLYCKAYNILFYLLHYTFIFKFFTNFVMKIYFSAIKNVIYVHSLLNVLYSVREYA